MLQGEQQPDGDVADTPVAVAGTGRKQRQIFAIHPTGIGMSQWRIMQGVEVAGDPAALLVAQPLAQAQPAGDPQHHQRVADGTALGHLTFRLVREPALQFVVGGKDAAAVVAGVQAQQLPRGLVARGEVARQQQALRHALLRVAKKQQPIVTLHAAASPESTDAAGSR
ncbi:hypothetical protein [Citrobacter pasteurii]